MNVYYIWHKTDNQHREEKLKESNIWCSVEEIPRTRSFTTKIKHACYVSLTVHDRCEYVNTWVCCRQAAEPHHVLCLLVRLLLAGLVHCHIPLLTLCSGSNAASNSCHEAPMAKTATDRLFSPRPSALCGYCTASSSEKGECVS